MYFREPRRASRPCYLEDDGYEGWLRGVQNPIASPSPHEKLRRATALAHTWVVARPKLSDSGPLRFAFCTKRSPHPASASLVLQLSLVQFRTSLPFSSFLLLDAEIRDLPENHVQILNFGKSHTALQTRIGQKAEKHVQRAMSAIQVPTF